MSDASSVFSLATFARPAYSVAICSTTGPTMRHGPHHGAQKSTNTVPSWETTSLSKFSFVSSITFSAMCGILSIFLKCVHAGDHPLLKRPPRLRMNRETGVMLMEFRGRHAMPGQNDLPHFSRTLQIVMKRGRDQ